MRSILTCLILLTACVDSAEEPLEDPCATPPPELDYPVGWTGVTDDGVIAWIMPKIDFFQMTEQMAKTKNWIRRCSVSVSARGVSGS